MMHFLTQQHRAINICFVMVFVLGFLSLMKLGREELPEFDGTGLDIYAVLPGASPAEMDLTVGRLLIQAVIDLPGVEEVRMDAREGIVSLDVAIRQDESDIEGLRREITQRISQVADLPVDLEGPYVSREISRVFSPITLLFKGGNDLERHDAWLLVEQKLLDMPAIDDVQVLGDRTKRIEVRANPLALEQAGLALDQLTIEVRQSITDSGAGTINRTLASTRFRTLQQPDGVERLKSLMIRSDAGVLPLAYFADVVETLSPEQVRITHGNDNVWYVNVYRRKGSNVSELSDRVNQFVDTINGEYYAQNQPFQIEILYDRSTVVSASLSQLTDSILLGMGLVFIILWIFLGSRNALYAVIGIPFSFFAAFIAMDLLGISINILTLFGLVLVSGMIVDDAIVVLENIDKKRQSGLEPSQAIIEGLQEVAPAVVAATGTTIAVFLPLMLMSGDMGMYISLIPKVAILALIASLVECFVVLPIHIYASGKTVSPDKQFAWQDKLQLLMERSANLFAGYTDKLLERPYWSLLGFAGLLVVTTWIAYLRLDFEFFDADETRLIKFHVEFESIVDLESTDRLMKGVAQQLTNSLGLDSFAEELFTDVVLLAGYSNYNYQATQKSHVATLELPLTKTAIERSLALSIADIIEPRLLALPGVVHVQRSLETNSPPTGVPVEIYLYGEDIDALLETVRKVRETLSLIPSIRHISNPMENGLQESVFSLDSKRIGNLGLDADKIGQLLRMSITGTKVGKIDRHTEVVDVLVKTKDTASPFQVLSARDGVVIPQSELGVFVEQSSPESIFRWQGLRYVSITAAVDERVLSVFQTHREIERLITDSILSPGITFEQKGEFSELQKSLASMIQSAILGLGLSYFILTLLFRSFIQPVVVLLAIPLAYMGVVWGMTLTNQPLSLMGFVGIVGLMGIVINDSLVWVSFYNRSRLEGSSSREAAVLAVKMRFRPIWLTTITTVGGLLPVSLSQSAGIANAMANTMVYGLMSASIFLLLFLPVCVVVLENLEARIRLMSFPWLTDPPIKGQLDLQT